MHHIHCAKYGPYAIYNFGRKLLKNNHHYHLHHHHHQQKWFTNPVEFVNRNFTGFLPASIIITEVNYKNKRTKTIENAVSSPHHHQHHHHHDNQIIPHGLNLSYKSDIFCLQSVVIKYCYMPIAVTQGGQCRTSFSFFMTCFNPFKKCFIWFDLNVRKEARSHSRFLTYVLPQWVRRTTYCLV